MSVKYIEIGTEDSRSVVPIARATKNTRSAAVSLGSTLHSRGAGSIVSAVDEMAETIKAMQRSLSGPAPGRYHPNSSKPNMFDF